MRNLTNSLLGGQLFALFLTQGVILVNPNAGLETTSLLRLWAEVALTYGLVLGLAYWTVLFLFEQIRQSAFRPAWLSFRLLIWLLIVDLAAAGALFWHNLFYYRLYLPADALRALATAATTLSGAAAVLLVLAAFQYSFGRRAAPFGYALFVLTAAVSAALPLWAPLRKAEASPSMPRLPLEDSPSSRRLTIIGMEAASLSYILPATAEGKLPNFAHLIEGGASGALKTLHPTDSLAVWTSIATGKLPRQHGLCASYRYRFAQVPATISLLPHGIHLESLEPVGLLKRSPVTSAERHTETFWSILTSFGVRIGLLRWWGTYPAEKVEGFVVSELFLRQIREGFDPPLPGLTYPADLLPRIAPFAIQPDDISRVELERYVDPTVQIPGDTLAWEPTLRSALADDETYQRIGLRLRDIHDPQVFGITFFGLDSLGHLFFRYHRPERFGDVSDLELQKYGRVIETYYNHLDTILGEYLQSLRPDETLIVISGHGMDPLPVTQRIMESLQGEPHRSGYHDDAPDGLALFYGPGIAHGAKFQGASVVDITPTLLYLMGLPIGQDMEGHLIAEVLEESLSRSQPVTYISSYHNFLIEPRREQDRFELPPALDTLPDVLEVRE